MIEFYGQKRYLKKVIQLIERNDRTMTSAVLNGFHISEVKLTTLAMALINNTHVKSLHLDGNAISDKGAVLLAYTLLRNSSIEIMSLSDNVIRSAGADAIANVLNKNRTLRVLSLANNSIGNHGARSLRKALKCNSSVTDLILDGNLIGQKTAKKFDNRCRIMYTVGRADDTTASAHSTSDTDRSDKDDTHALQEFDPRDKVGDFNTSAEALASSEISIFGPSLYDHKSARQYIIGDAPEDEDHDEEDLDASMSFKNLESYMNMLLVQQPMEQQEKDEQNYKREVKGIQNDDTLSLSSDTSPGQQLKLVKNESGVNKILSVFKKSKSIKG